MVGAITLLILSYPEGNLPMALFWGLWIPLLAVMAILRLSFFGYLIFFSVLIIILALASNKRVEFDVRFFLCSVLISIAWLTLDLYACVKLQEWM